MSIISKYQISLQLNLGQTNDFNFDIDNSFFEHLNNSEMKGGKMIAKTQIYRNANSFLINISIKGFVLVACDRCLDLCKVKVDVTDEIVAEFAYETNFDTGNDNIYVSTNDTELNLNVLLHDLILTSLPVKRIHNKKLGKDQVCNPEMIEILNKHIVEEENYIDPRWEVLKEIKN